MSGAAPLDSPLTHAFIDIMTKRGVNPTVHQGIILFNTFLVCINYLHIGYGLTETSPIAMIVPRDWAARKYGSAGALLPSLECRLVEDDGTTDAAEGEPGEIWIRGPSVMKVRCN
jgi:4-coumarate--CoA ligase